MWVKREEMDLFAFMAFCKVNTDNDQISMIYYVTNRSLRSPYAQPMSFKFSCKKNNLSTSIQYIIEITHLSSSAIVF